jgi:hypothetical protein
MSVIDRVAQRTASIDPVRVLRGVVAYPLYVVGYTLGLLFLLAAWLWAAAATGFSDGRAR